VRRLFDSGITPVWALLMVLTVISWVLGTHQGFSGSAHKVATVVVLTVGFIKVGFVGAYFMELRAAPLGMRLLFGTWCVGFCLALNLFFVLG
jgi:uncharacterized membrane protein YhaH (DUF805 family)